MKFVKWNITKCVSQIINSCEIVSAIASAIVYAVKFMNLFARRHHLFDVAAKPIDVDSSFLSYPAAEILPKT